MGSSRLAEGQDHTPPNTLLLLVESLDLHVWPPVLLSWVFSPLIINRSEYKVDDIFIVRKGGSVTNQSQPAARACFPQLACSINAQRARASRALPALAAGLVLSWHPAVVATHQHEEDQVRVLLILLAVRSARSNQFLPHDEAVVF